jgi:Cys-tRNA(Pro) deacylase
MKLIEKKIKKLLGDQRIEFKEFSHEAVYTCEVAEKVRKRLEDDEGYKNTGIKNLLLETEERQFILSLNPGNKRVNTKKIAKLEKTSRIRLAKAKDVERVVGCPIGCVPPFGHKKQIKTYIDKQLLKKKYLYFNPGNHSKTIKIHSKDLLKLIEKPIIY